MLKEHTYSPRGVCSRFIQIKYDDETKVIEFTIEEPMLRFWNAKNEFVSEPGLFEISTGYADHLIHTKKLILE